MRPKRIRNYVHPDDWEGEKVKPVCYPLTENGSIYGVRLVGLQFDASFRWLDSELVGPQRLRGVFADVVDGRRVHYPEWDGGRDFAQIKDDRRPNGRLWMHKWALTPIEELQTPWLSSYGHAEGEGYGMQFCLIAPMPARLGDVYCQIGRWETHRAALIKARLAADAPQGVRTFLEWLLAPGRHARHADETIRAQWITYMKPAVLWCCSPTEADALWQAISGMLSDGLIEAFARNKGTEDDSSCHDPRLVMAEHLEAVTKAGESGRYLAAAAFRRLGGEANFWGFQSALSRQGFRVSIAPGAPMAALVERLGLTDEDLRQLAQAERTLGIK